MPVLHAPFRINALAALRVGTAALLVVGAGAWCDRGTGSSGPPRGGLRRDAGRPRLDGGAGGPEARPARPRGLGAHRLPLGDEGHVLGVADSGARVTAPTPTVSAADSPARGRSGRWRRGTCPVRRRFGPRHRRDDGVARVGARVLRRRGWLLRREEGRWSVVRIAPAERRLRDDLGGGGEERVGRPRGQGSSSVRGASRASSPVREARQRYASPRGGSVVLPDPLEACGEGRARLVLPHAGGDPPRVGPDRAWRGRGAGASRSPWRRSSTGPGASEVRALGPWNEVFPLPNGGLLGLDGREAARFDDRSPRSRAR